jgi:hypothetical protein
MTQTLATLPSSQRAPFSRIQASIRSAYHRSVNARKNAEFRAHLSATTLVALYLPMQEQIHVEWPLRKVNHHL